MNTAETLKKFGMIDILGIIWGPYSETSIITPI